tara:strand:- start:1064 stop:1474 length:411 start_codon:yes stop_codon:yes gene_type:complete
MASELKVNTLTGVSTAGSIAVTAEGNSTTTNLQQGLAKVWAYFNQASSSSTPADSFNVSSIDDDSAGDFDVNYTNAMVNNTYASAFNSDAVGNAIVSNNMIIGAGYATTELRFLHYENGSLVDATAGTVMIMGDLA